MRHREPIEAVRRRPRARRGSSSSSKGRKFTYETVVRETQLDSFGHINHAWYFQLFEDARWDMITQNGYGIDKIKKTGLGPTILQIKIRYREELQVRQRIRIESQCVSYKRTIGTLVQRMFNETGDVCCTAEFIIGLLDINRRKLVAPNEAWKRAMGI
ncbi:MAG: acyl-CoA thioesterase [Acidobacteriota bacterium]